MAPYTQGFWLFCGLGACVFAALATNWRRVVFLTAGFIAATAWVRLGRMPDPAWMEGLAVCIVILIFMRPKFVWVAIVFGGILASLLGSLLQFEGVGVFPAMLSPAALLVVSVGFGMCRPKFAPAAIRDDALILIAVLGLLLAVAPGLAEGWRSAVTLNVGERGASSQAVPVWVLVMGGASLGLGGAYSVWRRS
ncbi:MAG TPA: hypothetical protein VGF16_06970 [Bryobacteraceae bacterium]